MIAGITAAGKSKSGRLSPTTLAAGAVWNYKPPESELKAALTLKGCQFIFAIRMANNLDLLSGEDKKCVRG
jgi:hypothetical protein